MWNDSSGGWWEVPGLGSAGEEALAGFAHASPASSIDSYLAFLLRRKCVHHPSQPGNVAHIVLSEEKL